MVRSIVGTLVDVGATTVLCGHSERRADHEDDPESGQGLPKRGKAQVDAIDETLAAAPEERLERHGNGFGTFGFRHVEEIGVDHVEPHDAGDGGDTTTDAAETEDAERSLAHLARCRVRPLQRRPALLVRRR